MTTNPVPAEVVDPIVALIRAVQTADAAAVTDALSMDHLNAVYEAAQDTVALFNRLHPQGNLYKLLDGMAAMREHNLARRTTLAQSSNEVLG